MVALACGSVDSSRQARKKKAVGRRFRTHQQCLTPVVNHGRRKTSLSDMIGCFSTSRRLVALHATGEGRKDVKKIPQIYDITNSNPLGTFVADGRGIRSRIKVHSRARIGTWNIRTSYQTGKLANVIQEMN